MICAIIAVLLGWSVLGVTGALVLSFIAAWLTGLTALRTLPKRFNPLPLADHQQIIRYLGPVMLGLVGQIVINNSDVLIVKSFYPDLQAGLYAGLALTGRIGSTFTVILPIMAANGL